MKLFTKTATSLKGVFAALLLIQTQSACTSQASANAEEQDIVQESSETLIAKAPNDWQMIFELNNGDTRLSDFIPADEDKDNWQTKLSFEAHAQLSDIDPIAIMMGEISKKNDICSNIDHSNLYSGLENGYPTSVRLILCGENAHTSKGEVSISKGIQGQDFFYIVRLERKVEAFEKGKPTFDQKQIAEWSTYLKRIFLCDTATDNVHACPSSTGR